MKKVYLLIVLIALIVGFIVGQQHTICNSTVAYRQDGKFELNVNNGGVWHRFLKDNQTTEKVY